MILYIISIILLLIFLVIIIPLKVKLKYIIKTNFNKEDSDENINILNYIDIYIFRIIKVKRIKIQTKQKSDSDSKIYQKNSTIVKVIFDTIYKLILDAMNYKKFDEALLNRKDLKKINKALSFQKVDIDIGINLKNVILNAYLISFLNAVINMYIAKNVNKFNLKDTKYTTFISNEILNLKTDCIINLKLVNTIIVIIKTIFKFRKVVNKDGRTTSNRKFNDDSYDFT